MQHRDPLVATRRLSPSCLRYLIPALLVICARMADATSLNLRTSTWTKVSESLREGTAGSRRLRTRTGYSTFDEDGLLEERRAYGSSLNEDVSGTEDFSEEGIFQVRDDIDEGMTGSAAEEERSPYIMEFSVLICEGKRGCGKADKSPSGLGDIDKYFKDHGDGDWPEPERLVSWEAVSPREEEDGEKDNATEAYLGTPRVPTSIEPKKMDALVEYFAETLDVPKDVVYVRNPSRTINPDNGMLRIPFAVWLEGGRDDVRRAASLIRGLQTDKTHLLKRLGLETPEKAPGPWVWVDSWCPPQGGPEDTPVGCRTLDLSAIRKASIAVERAGLGDEPKDYPRYPKTRGVGTIQQNSFSMVVRARDQTKTDQTNLVRLGTDLDGYAVRPTPDLGDDEGE